MSDGRILAIDIGGTKLAAGLVTADGAVVRRDQVPTAPSESGAGDGLWLTLRALLDRICDGETPTGVGVGCGGPMNWLAGAVSPLNLPAWREFPLRARLRETYPGLPVRLANDAIAMAAGEHWRGAGRSAANVLGVVVSTGVGGGLILDGRARFGPTGNAGHIGHVVVSSSGPPCRCGGRGCLEAIARGPAVVEWAQANGWRPAADEAATGFSLLAGARDGDEIAVAALARAGNALGVAVASTAHLLDLDVVVVGGGLSAAGELLLEPAQAAFATHARMDFVSRLSFVPAELGVNAGLVGAAALVGGHDAYWPAGAD